MSETPKAGSVLSLLDMAATECIWKMAVMRLVKHRCQSVLSCWDRGMPVMQHIKFLRRSLLEVFNRILGWVGDFHYQSYLEGELQVLSAPDLHSRVVPAQLVKVVTVNSEQSSCHGRGPVTHTHTHTRVLANTRTTLKHYVGCLHRWQTGRKSFFPRKQC